MNNNEIRDDYADYKRIDGIKGLMIIVAAWVVVSPLFIAANYVNLSQLRVGTVRYTFYALPESFYTVGEIGYMVLFPLSVLMLVAILKRLKVFIYLEMINFLIRAVFLYSLYRTLNDPGMLQNQLAGYLFQSVLASAATLLYFLLSKKPRTICNKPLKSLMEKKPKKIRKERII